MADGKRHLANASLPHRKRPFWGLLIFMLLLFFHLINRQNKKYAKIFRCTVLEIFFTGTGTPVRLGGIFQPSIPLHWLHRFIRLIVTGCVEPCCIWQLLAAFCFCFGIADFGQRKEETSFVCLSTVVVLTDYSVLYYEKVTSDHSHAVLKSLVQSFHGSSFWKQANR